MDVRAEAGGDEVIRVLAALERKSTVSVDESRTAVAAIVRGNVSEPLLAALLTAIRFQGETAEILIGAVEAAREVMTPFESPVRPLLDTCGTGGDGTKSVNVSTAAAIVCAAAGVTVAKHGNRSATGNSGSSDVLEALGLKLPMAPATVQRSLSELGIGFLFAPDYHPALRHAAAVRRLLPFRTIFNLIGPLVNPAKPEFQLIGVPSRTAALVMATAMVRTGLRRGAVVCGSDGMDEVTLAGPTHVWWVEDGHIEPRRWTPADYGLETRSSEGLAVSGPSESAAKIRRLLEGESGLIREIVLANAASAMLVAGAVENLREGFEKGAAVVDDGSARQLLERWIELSKSGSN